MLVFGVLRKRWKDTEVNVLEKSDLGQWSCLHLSLWQAGALGGCVVLNKGESERQVRREPALSNGKEENLTRLWFALSATGTVLQAAVWYKPNQFRLFIEDQDS